jgi:ATP-dependent Clp protease protease subunit
VEIEPGRFPDQLRQAMFDRRILFVSGDIDDVKAAELSASLMALDALSDDPVELRMNAWSGSLDAAFSLIDTIDALGVHIRSTVAGRVSGTIVGVVAVCPRRRIGASGLIKLREPTAGYTGSASDIERQARFLDRRFGLYLHRLADATGRPFEHLEADHRSGLILDPGEAVSYGLVDEVA